MDFLCGDGPRQSQSVQGQIASIPPAGGQAWLGSAATGMPSRSSARPARAHSIRKKGRGGVFDVVVSGAGLGRALHAQDPRWDGAQRTVGLSRRRRGSGRSRRFGRRTARRECLEEIGVDLKDEDIVGALSPLYIPPRSLLCGAPCGGCQRPTHLRVGTRRSGGSGGSCL